ncbi:hypothetical protein HK104_008812 [Borealophlyctis nickersoniae]|nr:hypothetical protein HK104_008812 [Borealophlyctis nickersoniae]
MAFSETPTNVSAVQSDGTTADGQDAVTVTFTVAYKGAAHTITLPTPTTIAALKEHLAAIPTISLPIPSQKLLFKGKSNHDDSMTLSSLGVKPNAKLLLVGSSASEITAVQDATAHAATLASRRRAATAGTPSRASQPVRTLASLEAESYTFQRIETLPGFSDTAAARKLLERLRDDIGIRTIMRKYKWMVGVLKELHPADRTILGFNENKGQQIALRLRTNDLDGFRHFDTIRKVLLHELAHMVHSEHNADFHALNRLLNRECDASNKTHRLSSERFYNAPNEEQVDAPAFEGGTFVLGGRGGGDRPMREVLAEAALLRLTKEEEELTKGCGVKK